MARRRKSKAERDELRRDLRVLDSSFNYIMRDDSTFVKADIVKIKASSVDALSLFNEGVKLYTNISLNTFSIIKTEEDVLRYLYRLYR